MKTILLFSFILSSFFALSQFAQNRIVNWTNAGLVDSISEDIPSVSIIDFGAIPNDGLSDDDAILAAISSLGGSYGKVIFPGGDFLFNNRIIMHSGLILQGQGSELTILRFNLTSAQDLILVQGTINSESIAVIDAKKGNYFLKLDNSIHGIIPGDILKLSMDGTAFIFSDWALSCMAQVVRVDSVRSDTIFIASGLRHNFVIENSPIVQKITPIKDVSISNMKIIREDETVEQTSNIAFIYAYNCAVRAIESEICNFSHISVSFSTNISIAGSYIHHGFTYGGNGRAYGVEISASSGECLVENNIFEHVRHSILFQSGANGNVAAYNYSFDAYWTESALPSNSAGDLVLHGNYTYCNLFEGNIAQNAVIDDSHGINGPYNTYFRNRLEKYGIVMNFNPATDSSNIVGNEISNSSFLMGNYTLFGIGNFTYGNNVKGTVTPAGTSNIETNSLYLDEAPCYFGLGTYWPPIGYPNNLVEFIVPAKQRYLDGIMTFDHCETNVSVTNNSITENCIYPNPSNGEINLSNYQNFSSFEIYDLIGNCILKQNILSENLCFEKLKSGVYIIKLISQSGIVKLERMVVL
jgi:hypothetical protein